MLLYEAIRECLLNTVKHAQVAAADVAVTQDREGLKLIVTDAGVGFDPSSLRVAGGTVGGVGLLGIRERLEALGGRLEIASTAGEGSRFTLIMPLPPVPETAPVFQLLGVSAAVAGACQPEGRGTRVLIVDDHALVRRGVASLVANEPNLSVVGEAADGQRAIELTRQLAPDVILMDISVPLLDGIEATRAIHAEFPTVRVIGLSMFAEPAQAAAMRDAGAVPYLSKTDPPEALLAAIGACRTGGQAPRPRGGVRVRRASGRANA